MSFQQQDIFSSYKAGIDQLISQLDRRDPRYEEALIYQHRLLVNIDMRRYGDSEQQKSELAQIINQLNLLALATLNMSFNELSGLASSEAPSYTEEMIYRQQMAEMYRELGFVGIPDLRERSPITVKDLFIGLRTAPQADIEEEHGLLEVSRRAESVGDRGIIERFYRRNNKYTRTSSTKAITIEETLRRETRFVILGDPGAGKTTLLKYFTVICAEEYSEASPALRKEDGTLLLPIFVTLGEFAAEAVSREQDYSLLDYLYTNARERLMIQLRRNFFEKALDNGDCLVCLDGLDEIWAVGQRKRVCDAVKALVARFPNNRYVVSSRIVGYEDAPLDHRHFAHHTILPLTDESIREFVHKWYLQHEQDLWRRERQIKKLLATIERQPRIQQLARNPLLLTIIALVHYAEDDLPPERVKLYDKCVTTLVEKWDEVKGLTIEEKQRPFYRYKRSLLERLAYELHTRAEQPGQAQTLKEGDLKLLLMRFLMDNRRLELTDDPSTAQDEARAFVQLVRSRTGLLMERGDGVFGFPHLTFQEYLTACDLEYRSIQGGGEAIWGAIRDHLRELHWREVILLLLGNLNKYGDLPTELIERILEAGKHARFESVFHYHLYLVAHALADRVDVAVSLRRQVVDALLKIACSEWLWQREDAFAALARLSDDRYVFECLLLLVHNNQVDRSIRVEAAKTLGLLGLREETVVVLLEVADSHQIDMWVRCAAIEALGQIGRAEVQTVTVLRALTRNKQVNTEVRRAAIVALGQIERADEQNVTTLLDLDRSNQFDSAIRLTIAVTLSQIGAVPAAVEILIELGSATAIDSLIRGEAVMALGQIGHIEDRIVSTLVKLALNRRLETNVRNESIKALGVLGRDSEGIVKKLSILMHLTQTDTMVRCAAAMALSQLGSAKEAVEMLLRLGRGERADTEVFGIIVRSLRRIGRDGQIDADVRTGTAQALLQLHRAEEAVEVLLELSRDPQLHSQVQQSSIDSLSKLASNRKFDLKVRRLAAEALVEVGQIEEAAKVLSYIASNRNLDPGERHAATIGLAQAGRKQEAVDILIGMAGSRQINIGSRRTSIVLMLQLIEDPQLSAEIHQMIGMSLRNLGRDQEMDSEVRLAAAVAIERLGYAEETVEIMLELGHNRQLYVGLRRDAAKTLLKLVRNRTVDAKVRQRAADVLCQMGRAEKVVEVLLELAGDRKANAAASHAAKLSVVAILRDPALNQDFRRDVLKRFRYLLEATAH